ncbi:MAG TPA: hypothetical protein VIO61_03380 [Anaerolineaceae bacterium]
MKQDRFLTGIIVGIALLAVVALGLFFARKGNSTSLPDDTPEGVVQNYVIALQRGDYEKAYTYLAEGKNKPDLANFRQMLKPQEDQIVSATIEIGTSGITKDRAVVDVTIIRSSGGIFSDVYRDRQTAQLTQTNGNWKINQMPYPFWSYEWFEPVPAKSAPAIN